jgi:outer membrane protein assembly factor BamD (BamD/ComL family)
VARPRVLATRELKHARATTTPATRRDPPATADDLRGEIDLIDAARGALRTGTATRALELLGRYAARFPHGSLAPEGTALRVEALMRLGRSAEARAIARRFVAANPTSPLVERMNSLAR